MPVNDVITAARAKLRRERANLSAVSTRWLLGEDRSMRSSSRSGRRRLGRRWNPLSSR